MSRRSGKTLLVYHRPGVPSERAKIEKLAAALAGAGIEAETATIEEALSKPVPPSHRVFLLMFTRGGHWLSLVEKGYRVELVPLHLTAAAVAAEASRRGYSSVLLVALRAHRLRGEQEEDILRIKHLLEKVYDIHARLNMLESLSPRQPSPSPAPGEAVAPLALLDGRLVHKACSRAAQGQCLGPIIDYADYMIKAWIIDRVAHSWSARKLDI